MSKSAPQVVGKDSLYLVNSVGNTLAEALARVAIVQPTDPVDYLGRYILKERENEEREKLRAKEAQDLAAQRSDAERAREQARQEAILREKSKAIRRTGQYLTDLNNRVATVARESHAGESVRPSVRALLAIARDLDRSVDISAGSAPVTSSAPASSKPALSEEGKVGSLSSRWVTKVEGGSHDPSSIPVAERQNVKVDERHALFLTVKALLFLLGYKDTDLASWEAVRKILKKDYFLKQFELFRPDLLDPATFGARLARAALTLQGARLDQLHSSPLVGTVILEYLRQASEVLEEARGSQHKVSIIGGRSASEIGKGTIAVKVEGEGATGGIFKAKVGEQPEAVFPFPALNTKVLDKALTSQPLELTVTWSVAPEPKPPTPPPVAAPVVDDEEEGSEEDSEEEERKRRAAKAAKKGGKKEAVEDKKGSKSKKKSKRDEDSEDEAEDEDNEGGKGIGRPKRVAQWEPDVDVSVAMLDAMGSLVDTVHFARPTSRRGGVSISEYGRAARAATNKFVMVKGKKVPVKADDALSAIPRNTEVVSLDLSRVPASVTTLAFTLATLVPGENFAHIIAADAILRVKTAQHGLGVPLAHLVIPGGHDHTATLVALLSRSREDPHQWSLRATCDPVPNVPHVQNPHLTLEATRGYLSEFKIGSYLPSTVSGSGRNAPNAPSHHRSGIPGNLNEWDLSPGQSLPVTTEDISIGFSWRSVKGKASFPVEVAGVVLDGSEVSATVTADNPVNDDATVLHSGEDLASLTPGDLSRLSISLGSMSKNASAVVVTASVSEEECSLRDLDVLVARVVDNETGKEISRVSLRPGDLSLSPEHFTAVLLKVYRKRDGWEVCSIGTASEARGPSELSEELEVVSHPHWTIPLSLRPGSTLSLPGDSTYLSFGGHSLSPSLSPTVDAACVLYQEGKITDTITKDKIKSNDKAVIHSGDSRENNERDSEEEEREEEEAAAEKDSDVISINFLKLTEKVDTLVFSVTVRETDGASLLSLSDVYLRVLEEETKREIARFTLDSSHSSFRNSGVVMCKVYRDVNGGWCLTPLGLSLPTRTPDSLSLSAAEQGMLVPSWNPPYVLEQSEAFYPNTTEVTVSTECWVAEGPAPQFTAGAMLFSKGNMVEVIGKGKEWAKARTVQASGHGVTLHPHQLTEASPEVDLLLLTIVSEENSTFQNVELTRFAVSYKKTHLAENWRVSRDVRKTKTIVVAKAYLSNGRWLITPVGESFMGATYEELELQLAKIIKK